MRRTIDAIRRQVVVAASQRRAFEVFTAEMTSWWPPEHHIGSTPIEQIIIEPREGGAGTPATRTARRPLPAT